jgi:RNA polymerase sigma-70 factor (ECF subfamily)
MAANSSGPPTRPTLLFRIRDPHDHAAWTTFVDVYGPLIYARCRRRGLQPVDAENVTQTVFVTLSQAIGQYQPDKGRFRSWLGRIVRNAIHRARQGPREVTGWGHGDEEDPLESEAARQEDSAWAEEFNHHIYQTALDRTRGHFEDQTWRAFDLVWQQNLSAGEAARRLRVPIDRVYVAKSRVLDRLRQEIEHLAADSALLAG